MESVTSKEEQLEVISWQPLSPGRSLMVCGDTPTSPLVSFVLLNPVTLSGQHLAIALKATKSLNAFSRIFTLLAHLEQICEGSLFLYWNV